jgi:hypothetical protein
MDKKIEILTARKWLTNYYAIQVVYEWEDILSKEMNVPVDSESLDRINTIYNKRFNHFLQRVIRKTFLADFIDSSFNYLLRKRKGVLFINYQLYVIETPNHYAYQPNSIPIFIDCFRDMVDKLPALCRRNPLVFVTDQEIYHALQKTDIAAKTRYLPLTISDKYFNKEVPEKKIDVLQIGRQNPVLHEWMIQLTQKHPQVEYVYAHKSPDEVHTYYSTKNGWVKEPTETRNQFIRFLSSARISLLSSPGMDGGDKARTGGFNPVTPRFYESAINYCYMVGRYPDTPDFIYNDVASVCERPADYESFEKTILQMLSTPFAFQNKYEPFIRKHLTSATAKTILAEIEKL